MTRFDYLFLIVLFFLDGIDPDIVLMEAQKIFRYRHQINHTTIQVEKYQPQMMDNCMQCQPLTS